LRAGHKAATIAAVVIVAFLSRAGRVSPRPTRDRSAEGGSPRTVAARPEWARRGPPRAATVVRRVDRPRACAGWDRPAMPTIRRPWHRSAVSHHDRGAP